MPGQETLGERIRSARLQKGLSQALLGWPHLSDSYVSLIEAGKRMPPPDVIELLARKLGCSPSYLRTGIPDSAYERLRTTIRYAQIALDNGEAAEARELFTEALTLPALAGLPRLEAAARWGHALACEACGDLEVAIRELGQIAATVDTEPDPAHFAEVHVALCRCRRERGDLDEATAYGDQALQRLTAGGRWEDHTVRLGVTVLSAYLRRGDLAYCGYLAGHLVERAETLGSPGALMAAYWQAAIVAEESGRTVDALALAERALAQAGEGDDDRNLRRMRWVHARMLFTARPDQADYARDLLAQAERDLGEGSVSTVDRAWCLTDLARAELLLGRPGAAATAAQRAVDLLDNAPRLVTANALTALATAHLHLGHDDQANRLLTAATTALQRIGTSRDAAQAWLLLADTLSTADHDAIAATALRSALACQGI